MRARKVDKFTDSSGCGLARARRALIIRVLNIIVFALPRLSSDNNENALGVHWLLHLYP